MNKGLVALAFYYANTSMLDAHRPQPMDETVEGPHSPYRLVKLFDDGTDEPVIQAKIDLAVEYVQERGWRAWGYWINDNPALVWARLPEDFDRVWGYKEQRAPCRYASRGETKRYDKGAYAGSPIGIGERGCLVPTRSRTEVYQLRARFPYYRGDLLMTPIEVLEADARQREEFTTQPSGSRLFDGSIGLAVEKAMAKVDAINAQIGGRT